MRRRLFATGVAVLATLAGVALSPVHAGTGDRANGSVPSDPGGVPPTSDIRMVQANIYTGLSTERFQADVKKVLAVQPDFVTYNEVPFRNDAVMAPDGYGIYRDMTDRFTAATPVAWREDRWTPIGQGSWMISNWRGKPPGKVVELGRRWANWVTFQGVDGRVLSVVSVHVAPVTKGMPDLLRKSMNRLEKLVAQLAPSGPVLVGGDFNVAYTGPRYPRDILTRSGLIPTYDNLASHFSTGDHHGYTIDYVFGTRADELPPVNHYPIELKSDHDAVVAEFTWTVDAPSETTIVSNNPAGTRPERRAALTSLLTGIQAVEPGATIALATTSLEAPAVARQLILALGRGVHVRVVAASAQPTSAEKRLTKAIAGSGDALSSVRRCNAACQGAWTGAGLPRTLMMVSDASGEWVTRYDVARKLGKALVSSPTRVTVRVGQYALEDGQRMLESLG
ncbi:endonuclease/exonuclease/phosphatase family protein [Nocardioides sp. SR21]|uniref:endonuclease/exonuclease/phosphatase family protein n=1 Tax=Nocardioides sp. SR21 TaxID=2919501 RepID=UPI001FA9F7F6|nr:endonuclease/exonuclease/phosphatase family protein [Nocardioides sp. SR21]